MTVFEMAMMYYPRLWNKSRLDSLVDAGRLTKMDVEEIIAEKGYDEPNERSYEPWLMN